ncbi:MAG: NAD(P)-dependent alcohol dehydrogenase [Myxococcales bacterium]|nr:NAD(P)-dependent alcohol dehydrogenase [Myxococcales bacterium]
MTEAWELSAFGLENLRRVERPTLEPGAFEVRVRVRGASLNYRDLLMLEGKYDPRVPLPLVPLSDGAGVVDAVGPGVTRWKVGDRVAAIFAQRWQSRVPIGTAEIRSTLGGPLDGMAITERVLHEDGLVATPDHLSDVEAATLPCAALTAWSALREEGNVQAGDTVLILGTGGVSTFALQLCALIGARAIVTSSSDEKLDQAKDLGAWETVNYQTHPEWSGPVRELTGGVGVDHVIEVGGAGTLDQSIRSTRPGGHISLIGVLAGPAKVNLTRVLMNNICIQGVLVGHRAGFEAMNRAISAHGLRPVVDSTFSFGELPSALARLRGGAHLGKICVDLEQR